MLLCNPSIASQLLGKTRAVIDGSWTGMVGWLACVVGGWMLFT